MSKSIESIITRLISIGSKFLLITFLAKVLSLSDYGVFQLISYFVMISIYIYGLEYYMYGNREVAKGVDVEKKINKHINFFITLLPVTFFLQIVALFYLIPSEILDYKIIVFILFINFCEYYNQEIYRYLIMVQEISKANILLVAKTTTFLLLVISYHFFIDELSLYSTLIIMFVSYIILLFITNFFFFRFVIKGAEIKITLLSVKEIKKTLKFLLPFIGLMIFTKGLEFFDKFAIEYFYGTKEVGIYSFLFSISTLVYIFIVSGFYLVYLPEFIKLYDNKDIKLKDGLIKFSVLTVVFSLLLSIGIILFIDVLLNLIGKENLIENINILYILLGANFFLNISLIPKIILYISNRDHSLMKISGVLFFINIILNIFLLKCFNIKGAAIALLITYFIGFLITSYISRITWKQMKKDFS